MKRPTRKAASERRILVFDTETTGLPLHPAAPLDKQPRCIEFGGTFISCDDGSVLGHCHHLVNPGIPITAEITKITGIRQEDVDGKPTFEKVRPAIAAAFESCIGVLAHNLPFDQFIIDTEIQRLRAKGEVVEYSWPQNMLCTIALYRGDYGFDPKLLTLYQRVTGKQIEQKHRAESDVAMLVEIVQKDELWRLV